jgi:uncharacterized membrane protein YedE/YeeE
MRIRFWIECFAFVAAIALAALTLVWHDWIEAVFGVDPDSHSGVLEVAVTLVAAGIAVLMAFMARAEWRRAATLGTASSDS